MLLGVRSLCFKPKVAIANFIGKIAKKESGIMKSGLGTIPLFLLDNLLKQLYHIGYEIPKDTLALWSTLIFQEQFPNHDKFLPERWLKGQCPKIPPFSVRPFRLFHVVTTKMTR